MKHTKNTFGAVAAGHALTAKTAASILRDGGNAFDAVVGAQMTAFVAEPVLTSPGGGGFLFSETSSGRQLVYDFFVQTPKQKKHADELDFYPIEADFGEVKQEFHIGSGSVATPGIVKGLFEIHRDLCTMPMHRLAEPAINHARNGVVMNAFQSSIFEIVRPIYLSSDEATRIFGTKTCGNGLVREGDALYQPELANFLEMLVKIGEQLVYKGEIADRLVSTLAKLGGHLTHDDLASYTVRKRKPLQTTFQGSEISLNPLPAMGGVLITFAMMLMESEIKQMPAFGSRDYITLMAEIQQLTNGARSHLLPVDQAWNEFDNINTDLLQEYRRTLRGRLKSFRGTTQISVIDRDGNKASLTSSNGEGSGVMVPGTGIMLNNMLGEQDLNPGGFHRWKEDMRVSSMMAPGILKMKNGREIVFGSGGSNRIRTAILQVLTNLVTFEMTLEEAVNAPRLHFENGMLNAENGFSEQGFRELLNEYPEQKIWKKKSIYFGGAHTVELDKNTGFYIGAGDERRGGVAIVL